MRRCWALGPGLLVSLLLGCAAGPVIRGSGRSDHYASGHGALPPDSVLLDFVLLERPLGDRYINEELWKNTDEQMEGKEVVQENGFRVGHLVGMTPQRLQELLTSERGCLTRWRQIVPAGKPITLTISRPAPELRFHLLQDGQAQEVALEQAQSYLVAVPAPAPEGRTRWQFTPQVQFGATVPEFQPAPDRSGWLLSYNRRKHTYPQMSWEVTLAPNQYLVIGAAFDNASTLGYQSFVQEDGHPVQRLLVLRTMRAQANPLEDAVPAVSDSILYTSKSPPLALQATGITARGSRP